LKGVEGKFVQLADLPKIYLRSRDNTLVRLDSVATFKQTLGAAVVGRFDLQYAANFYGSPTIPLGQAVANVRQSAQEILPLGYSIKLVGQAEEFAKTVDYMLFAFVLAMILLYMVLASQFNSFVQPFIIMLAQPLAIVGGVAALWLSIPVAELGKMFGADLTPHTLNIYSMIGLVLLIGLVAKNSILLVDLTNQRREQGLKVDEALRNACPIRLRPVLMTSATMILALLPAALGFGAGSETNGPLAVAVIGGLISSTLLTLVVVPAVYSLVENGIVRWRSQRSS
jgi:HAE1 family hydrophobic/amphiphilic exporter-1